MAIDSEGCRETIIGLDVPASSQLPEDSQPPVAVSLSSQSGTTPDDTAAADGSEGNSNCEPSSSTTEVESKSLGAVEAEDPNTSEKATESRNAKSDEVHRGEQFSNLDPANDPTLHVKEAISSSGEAFAFPHISEKRDCTVDTRPLPPEATMRKKNWSPTKPKHHMREKSLASLASPSPTLEGFDTQQWNHMFRAPSPPADSGHHKRFSSSDMNLQVSPKSPPQFKESLSTHDTKGDAGLLAALFSQSFDNLDDADGYDLDVIGDVCSSPLGSKNRILRVKQSGASHRESQDVDISLPTLRHTRSHSSVFGDISPIKVFPTVTDEGMKRPGHRKLYSLTQPLPYYSLPDRHDATHARYPSGGGFSESGREISTPDLAIVSTPTPTPLNNRYLEGGEGWNQATDTCLFADSNVSNPFFVLRSNRKAFEHCTFLLPCLSKAETCNVNMSPFGGIRLYGGQNNYTSDRDTLVASRRVDAAVCAFGGNSRNIKDCGDPIFRPRGHVSLLNPDGVKVRNRQTYEQRLRSRYILTESRLSWDLEADPPVFADTTTSAHRQRPTSASSAERSDVGARKTPKRVGRTKNRESAKTPPAFVNITSNGKPRGSSTPSPTLSIIAMSSGTEPPKMRYRCKLCGQPKQNHRCPYRHAIQRSIGVMVQPAVNSFTSNEPGVLTPALSEMNNFVAYDSDQATVELVPSQTSEDDRKQTASNKPTSVTPDGSKSVESVQSPQSSLSAHSGTPHCTPQGNLGSHSSSESRSDSRKRSHGDMLANGFPQPSPHSPFCDVVPLRPEQFRAVTPPREEDPTAYHYHSLQLPYQQRKRLSDSLFQLAKQIPQLASDVAFVLRDARAKCQWDQAVAELMAQVVVAIHCKEGDFRLDGLQRYLLSLGISC